MQGYFDIGDRPVSTVEFFDLSGAFADPTTVKVVTRNPSGTETAYTYGVASEVAKTSTGIYTFTFPQFTATQAGAWYIRWNGTGTVTASFEDGFTVRASAYTTPLP